MYYRLSVHSETEELFLEYKTDDGVYLDNRIKIESEWIPAIAAMLLAELSAEEILSVIANR